MALPAVVLAAGGSTRMGSPKALLDLGGRTALARVIEAARGGGCDPVLVVAGASLEAVAAEARRAGARVVEHPGWAKGRTSSLKAALPWLPSGAPGLLLFPVDHPLVEAPVVRSLLQAFAAAPPPGPAAVVPVHGGRRGHPVVLAARLFPAVVALADDAPLRDLVRAQGKAVLEVAVPGDAVLRNLDRPGDVPGAR